MLLLQVKYNDNSAKSGLLPTLSFCGGLVRAARRAEHISKEAEMSKVLDQVEELVTPITDELGFELVDLAFEKEGKNWFLRIFIDKEGGIDIDECALVSEKVSEKLDESDPITQNYFLEVSSPGAERPLKKEADFEKAVGEYVHVTAYEQIDGRKMWEGTLLSYDGTELKVEIKDKTRKITCVIPKDKVAKARLAIEF